MYFRSKLTALREDERRDLNVITGAALTLLGLIIGFSFSLASSRYEQRKDYEEEEANAIGTEYLRVGLLPAADAARLSSLLKRYVDQRLLFYTSRDEQVLERLSSDTGQLQAEMWAIVRGVAVAQPTPIVSLVAAGMNDVLNTQGYTQAAWWNRLPEGAWMLMLLLAIGSNVLIGYGSSHEGRRYFTMLPMFIALAFFLISDIDAPRHGLIRVLPRNLVALSQSIHQQ